MKHGLGLRMIAATTRAAATGLANVALGRVEPSRVQLRAGDMAPGFTLAASDGRTYSLGDYRGRQAVLLAWFPRAFTPGCTAECRSLGASRDVLQRSNLAFFAASVDSVRTNAEFARALTLPHPILCDETKETALAYGVLSASGFPSRWTFFIGLDGRILDIDRDVHPTTHGNDIAARLTALGLS